MALLCVRYTYGLSTGMYCGLPWQVTAHQLSQVTFSDEAHFLGMQSESLCTKHPNASNIPGILEAWTGLSPPFFKAVVGLVEGLLHQTHVPGW